MVSLRDLQCMIHVLHFLYLAKQHHRTVLSFLYAQVKIGKKELLFGRKYFPSNK